MISTTTKMIGKPLYDDIQTVIFAGGKGSRISQLLFGKPKCLLPIANKPMIQYPLELLIRSNIKETFMIVLDTEAELIEKTVHKLGLDIEIKYVTVSSINDSATADSLRKINDKITKDILMLSCDTITDCNLDAFIQLYRVKVPTFACLLSSIGSEKENLVPARKLFDNKEFDIVGRDGKDPSRLVFFEPDVMFTDGVPLKRAFLEKCSDFTLQTNLQDAHIYLFQNWVLKYLKHKVNINSIKADFLPSLVRKQFRLLEPPPGQSSPEKNQQEKSPSGDDDDLGHGHHHHHHHAHLVDFVSTAEVYQVLDRLEELPNGWQEEEQKKVIKEPPIYPASTIKCYAHTVDTGYCIRANNWVGYCEANRVIINKLKASGARPIRSESVKSYVDGLVGPGSVVGEKCSIKRTVIGANCTIGDKVKLTNCILLDNCTVEEGCAIQGSVLCYDVHVGNKSEIKDCVVGPKQKIVPLSRHTNESLTEEMLDL